MSEQMRPASKELAPDPSTSYERARPENEAGLGRLDNNKEADPVRSPDKMEHAVTHKQPLRQLNAEETADDRHGEPLSSKE
jgi:hypothetical protein